MWTIGSVTLAAKITRIPNTRFGNVHFDYQLSFFGDQAIMLDLAHVDVPMHMTDVEVNFHSLLL